MRRVFTSWWFWTGLAVAIIVALFLFGLPLVVHFMRPWWVRIAFTVGVVLIWLTWAFLRWRRARKANAAIAEELAKVDPADEEEKALAERMKAAMASLRSAKGSRRNYLYNRPWYVIIGPPGAGKTTAILNSGLRFPFADQNLKGVGGLRNLDFWFADEAVLVDTAGRYTTQDSDRAVDASGWKSFLQLLRKYRPLQPINGVHCLDRRRRTHPIQSLRHRRSCRSHPSPPARASGIPGGRCTHLSDDHEGGSSRRLHRIFRRPRFRRPPCRARLDGSIHAWKGDGRGPGKSLRSHDSERHGPSGQAPVRGAELATAEPDPGIPVAAPVTPRENLCV